MQRPSRNYSEKDLQHRERDLHQHGKHRILKVLALILVLALAWCGSFAGKFYLDTRSAANKTYRGKHDKKADKQIKERKSLSILVLGVDTGEDGRTDRGNSDTIILVTINPTSKTTQLMSIPRDTAAQIVGLKEFEMAKVNSAYNRGGAEMSKDTVSKLLNIPVNYYLTLDMQGLEKVVNAVGGIDVDVPFTFTSEATGGQTFNKGRRHLDGGMALAYARMRHEDPEGDYGRQKRQQQVIKAIVKKATSLEVVQHLSELLSSLSDSMTTDISFDNMIELLNNYRDAASHIESDSLKGQNAWIQTKDYEFPLSFQIISEQELQRVSNKLRKELGLQEETIDNAETKQNALNSDFHFDVDYEQNYVFHDLDQDD